MPPPTRSFWADLVSEGPGVGLSHGSSAPRNLGIISVRGSAHQSRSHQQISDWHASEPRCQCELTRLRATPARRFLPRVFTLRGHSLKLRHHYCIFFSRHLLKTRLASSCYADGCGINSSILSALIRTVKKRCNYSFNTV